jgi:hypothetical protein
MLGEHAIGSLLKVSHTRLCLLYPLPFTPRFFLLFVPIPPYFMSIPSMSSVNPFVQGYEVSLRRDGVRSSVSLRWKEG